MEERAGFSVSFSPIVVVAALSVVALIGVSTWQATNFWRDAEVVDPTVASNEIRITTSSAKGLVDWQRDFEDVAKADTETSDVSNDPDGLSNIRNNVLGTLLGSYVALKGAGTYTPAQGEAIASAIAEDLRASVSYRAYTTSDVQTDANVSLPRMLSYRSDMQTALEPILKNTEQELEIFAYYIETKDAGYLEELRSMATNYRAATENTLHVVVPKDAVLHHIAIMNALSEFEMILERMASYADDPFATAALLRTFNDAEMNVLLSFDALATYFREYPQT